jgi:hypothetical protein
MNPDLLQLDEVLALHTRQLARFGGGSGVRDEGLLASAVAQPQASFGGALMHETLEDMAAAYLFHIVSNHPFIDGFMMACALSTPGLSLRSILGSALRQQARRPARRAPVPPHQRRRGRSQLT